MTDIFLYILIQNKTTYIWPAITTKLNTFCIRNQMFVILYKTKLLIWDTLVVSVITKQDTFRIDQICFHLHLLSRSISDHPLRFGVGAKTGI